MMTISERAVDLSIADSNTDNSSRTWQTLGKEIAVGVWFGVTSSPRPNVSGGFSPMGSKILRFMAGAAAVGGGTGLRT